MHEGLACNVVHEGLACDIVQSSLQPHANTACSVSQCCQVAADIVAEFSLLVKAGAAMLCAADVGLLPSIQWQ